MNSEHFATQSYRNVSPWLTGAGSLKRSDGEAEVRRGGVQSSGLRKQEELGLARALGGTGPFLS